MPISNANEELFILMLTLVKSLNHYKFEQILLDYVHSNKAICLLVMIDVDCGIKFVKLGIVGI